ncbi:MAG: DUF2029 domain-containing protein, partial [Chloroflexi bacterium]|nr:DUF2029 domain-containing protein [Chloroflexota bacterium]
YLMIGLYHVAALIPDWNGTGVWFYTLLGSALLLFETGNLVLVYKVATVLGDRATAQRSAWFYAGLFVPVYTLTGWFEAMPLFFFLLTLLLLVQQRHRWSAVTAGLGFLTKLIPIILFPLALRTLWQRGRGRWVEMAIYVVLLVATIVVAALPFAAHNPRLALSSLQGQAQREPWESIWALWDGQYSYGIVWADMRDLGQVGGPPMESRVPWIPITVAFGAAFLFLYTRPLDWRRPRAQVAFAGLCVLGLLLYSKGYSPQFGVWVLPFICWLLPNLRGAAYAIVLALINIVEPNVYFIILPSQHQLLTATVLLRTLVFLLLAGEYALVLRPEWAARLGQWRRPAAVSTVTLTLLTAVVLTPGLVRAYFAQSLDRNPCRETVALLQGQVGQEAALVFTRQETFDLFYPYLWRQAGCFMLDDYTGGRPLTQRVDQQVQNLLSQYREVWLVASTADKGSALVGEALASLDRSWPLLAEEATDRCWARLYIAPGQVAPLHGPNRLGDVARLRGAWRQADPLQPGGKVALLLEWEALGPSASPLTVFTHLVTEEGALVAGHDSPPAKGAHPTDGWQTGQTVLDPHLLALPETLPSGPLRLLVGLYDAATGQRLPLL